MESVGGGGCIGSVGINSFLIFFFTRAKYWDLATITCNLYFIKFMLYYDIIYTILGFTSLDFTWLRFWAVAYLRVWNGISFSSLAPRHSSLSLPVPVL